MTNEKMLLVGLIFMLFLSCEAPVEWELESSDEVSLTIDAVLTNEFKKHQVTLTTNFSQLNETPEAITDATVFILGQNNSVRFNLIDTEKGIYESEIAFRPANSSTGIIYVLQVEWQGAFYEASAQLAPVRPIPNIVIGTRLTGERFIAKVAEAYSPSQQAMYKINLDWSQIDSSSNLAQAQLSFYTFSTIDISGLLNPALESVGFPNGTLLIEKKFGLSDEYADYLRGLLVQTTWQGGAFDEAENNIQSNFSNNANGFFALCSVLSDTLIVR